MKDTEQLKRFQAAAREVEADHGARFNDRLRKLAETKPEPKDDDEVDD
ncbi:MAG: hypothetical protein WBF53_11755 [Litorimonas sp.]